MNETRTEVIKIILKNIDFLYQFFTERFVRRLQDISA